MHIWFFLCVFIFILVTKFTRADGTKVQIPTEEAIRHHKRISDYLDKVGKAFMGNIEMLGYKCLSFQAVCMLTLVVTLRSSKITRR
jgi:hypothetical protein